MVAVADWSDWKACVPLEYRALSSIGWCLIALVVAIFVFATSDDPPDRFA